MVDPAPAEVSDVDESVHTAEVDEYTVRGDVLDNTFEDLTFLELADDLSFLSFEFSLDKSLVRNYYVAVLVVDLDDLEVHGLVDEYIVVSDGLDIYL